MFPNLCGWQGQGKRVWLPPFRSSSPIAVEFPCMTSLPNLHWGPFSQSVHQQQQRQHQLEEKIQLLQQQKLPFGAPSDLPPEADFLDTSYGRTESSAASTPNLSPRASNHSAYSNVSTSDVGSCLSTEQEEGGKVDLVWFIVSLFPQSVWWYRRILLMILHSSARWKEPSSSFRLSPAHHRQVSMPWPSAGLLLYSSSQLKACAVQGSMFLSLVAILGRY